MLKLIRDLASPDSGGRAPHPLRIAKAVAWSFFGVRAGKDMDADTASITPLQAMTAGMLGAGALVVTLLTIVHLIV